MSNGDTMSQPAMEIMTDIQCLITEDDTPVDNLPSEKQQRLLTEPLYSAWAGPGEGRTFLAAANVGIFAHLAQPGHCAGYVFEPRRGGGGGLVA